MKVLLLQPLTPSESLWGRFKKGEGFVPPLGLLSIAGYLDSKGYQVTICDAQVEKYSEKDLEDYLLLGQFDFIGIPSFTNSIVHTFKTAEICKKILPNSRVIVGGVHSTLLPRQVLDDCPFIDIAVIGEGEYITEKLIHNTKYNDPPLESIEGIAYRDSNGRIIVNERATFIDDLNELPLPAYHLLDMSKYTPHATQYKVLPNFPVVIQRGCPFSCAFCNASCVHGKKIRRKSVKRIIEELSLLKNKYGARGIIFQDSTFTVNRKFVITLCESIIDNGLDLTWSCNTRVDCIDEELLMAMKKAGCWSITYGPESGNQKTLDLLKKNVTVKQNENAIKITHKLGINTFSSYILGLPGETFEDALKTINFAIKLGSHTCLFYIPTPYPGTLLVDLCRKDGGLREDAEWESYSLFDYSNPIYINPKIGKEGMIKLLDLAYKKYYSSPRVIFNNIKSIRSFVDIRRYFSAARALLNI